MIRLIIQFFREGIWVARPGDLPRPKALGVRALRVVMLAVTGFRSNGCDRHAAVLTYYSLLNIVPLFAVMFGIAKGFGLDRVVESRILELAETSNWQAEIVTQLLGFSRTLLEQTKGGIIAGVGVALLLWTVISILGRIEESFNTIWDVKRGRSLPRKFADYLAMLLLAPILFVISGSATVMIAGKVKVIVESISLLGPVSGLIFFILRLLPYVSIWALLSTLYVVMPNRTIPIRSGIIAGTAAGTIYQIVQWAYIKFQIGVVNYGAIYGSFAALPLFLVWLQLSWMIVLFGAEMAHALENRETYGYQPDYSKLSASARRLLALRILRRVVQRFSAGEEPLSVYQISRTLAIPLRLVRTIIDELKEARLISEVAGPGKNIPAFQPARSPEDLTIESALRYYDERGASGSPDRPAEDEQKIRELMSGITETLAKLPANRPLKDI
jgi:membrane protein